MKKGFVFSTDIFFSALIIGFFLASFPGQVADTSFDELLLARQAQDLLNVLTPSLETMDSSEINDSLTMIFPANLNYSLTVYYYNVDGSENTSMAFGSSELEDFVSAAKVFVVTSSGNVTHLGWAEVKLWV